MIQYPKVFSRPAAGMAAAALTLLLATGARADVKIYDTTLSSPDTTAANASNNLSWYNGTGNQLVQGGWTVDQDSGIELGLRAKYRQAPTVIDPATDDYTVLSGLQTSPSSTGKAKWNFEFSVNLRPNGGGTTLTLADITATLTVLDITNPGSPINIGSFQPFGVLPDNSGFGAGGAAGITSTGADPHATGNDWSFQNSENALLISGFDPSAARTYEFDLTVTRNSDGSTLATDDMEVIVTPEPSALILFGTVAFVALFARRRRFRSA